LSEVVEYLELYKGSEFFFSSSSFSSSSSILILKWNLMKEIRNL